MGQSVIHVFDAVADLDFSPVLACIKLVIHKIDPVVVMCRVIGYGVVHAAEDLHVHARRHMEGECGPARPLIFEANDTKVSTRTLVACVRPNARQGIARAADPAGGEEDHVVVGQEEVVAAVVVGILCQDVPDSVDAAMQTVQRGEDKPDAVSRKPGSRQHLARFVFKFSAQLRVAKHGVIAVVTVVDGETEIPAFRGRNGGGKGAEKRAKRNVLAGVRAAPKVLA